MFDKKVSDESPLLLSEKTGLTKLLKAKRIGKNFIRVFIIFQDLKWLKITIFFINAKTLINPILTFIKKISCSSALSKDLTSIVLYLPPCFVTIIL